MDDDEDPPRIRPKHHYVKLACLCEPLFGTTWDPPRLGELIWCKFHTSYNQVVKSLKRKDNGYFDGHLPQDRGPEEARL